VAGSFRAKAIPPRVGPSMIGNGDRPGVRRVVIRCGERSAWRCGLVVAAAARPGVEGGAGGHGVLLGAG